MSGCWALQPTPWDHDWQVATPDGRPIRWRGLLPGVGAAVAWLRGLDRPPATPLGVTAEHDPRIAVLIQAAPLAGCCLALLPRRLHAEDRRRLRADAGCDAVVGDDLALPERFDPTVALEADAALASAELGLVLATSGTGARPRTVALSWNAVLQAAATSADHLRLGPDDRWLVCLPLDHAGGALPILRAAVAGCAVELCPAFDLPAVDAALERCTGVSLVATVLARLLEHRGARPWPRGLRCILTGGAPLDPALRAACAARGRAPCHSYGLSETAGMVCAQDPAGETADDSGRPLPGVALRLVEGEIRLRSPATCAGHLVAGRLTPRAGDELATGDLGSLSAGRLTVTGRSSELIISGGENVSPLAVENVLCGHPAIRAAAIAGLPDPEWGQRIEAALVLAAPLDEAAFDAWLRAHLAPHQRPKRWLALDRLPTSPRGKLDRTALAGLLARDTRRPEGEGDLPSSADRGTP